MLIKHRIQFSNIIFFNSKTVTIGSEVKMNSLEHKMSMSSNNLQKENHNLHEMQKSLQGRTNNVPFWIEKFLSYVHTDYLMNVDQHTTQCFPDSNAIIPPIDPFVQNKLNKLTIYMGLLSEKDNSRFFSSQQPYHIALACMLTAFELMSRDEIPQVCRQRVADCAYQEYNIDCTITQVYECRMKLRSLFNERKEQYATRNAQQSVRFTQYSK